MDHAAEPGVAAEYTRINRDHDVLKAQYDKLVADRDNVRLRGQVEGMQTTTDKLMVAIQQSPKTVAKPATKNKE